MFSIFLNDLEDYYEDITIGTITEKIQTTLHIVIQIFVLYADDTVIFSESLESMQKALDIFQEYFNLWKLSVNSSKT